MTGSKTTRILGLAVLAGTVLLLWLGFVATTPDIRIDGTSGTEIGQYDAVRLMYIHVHCWTVGVGVSGAMDSPKSARASSP